MSCPPKILCQTMTFFDIKIFQRKYVFLVLSSLIAYFVHGKAMFFKRMLTEIKPFHIVLGGCKICLIQHFFRGDLIFFPQKTSKSYKYDRMPVKGLIGSRNRPDLFAGGVLYNGLWAGAPVYLQWLLSWSTWLRKCVENMLLTAC